MIGYDVKFVCYVMVSLQNLRIADRVHGLKWKVSNFVKHSKSLSN